MRVMLIADTRSIHTQRFTQWLLNDGWEITLVDYHKPENIDPSQVQFVYYPRGLPKRWKMFRWLRSRYRALVLGILWRVIQPDIVHLHFVNERAYESFLAKIRPIVFTCWGTDINQLFKPGADAIYSHQIGQSLSWANHIFADSDELLNRCEKLAGCSLSSTRLYFGIDTKLFHPGYNEAAHKWRKSLRIPAETKILLSVRAWTRLYRHELILEAYAQALQGIDTPTVLLFKLYLADDPSYEQEIRTLADELKISKNIYWLKPPPPDERMPELYSMVDFAINFPEVDGFPVSFIEAAACGKPVITSDLPAYRNSGVEDFFYLVSPNSINGLAQTIIDVLQSAPQELSLKSQLARKWAETYGDEQTSQRLVLDRYQQVIDSKI